MSHSHPEGFWDNFRRFFLRGLAIILPSILTIWILMAAYQFVQKNIAEPINGGIHEAVLLWTDWPRVTDEEVDLLIPSDLSQEERKKYEAATEKQKWKRGYIRRQKLEKDWGVNRFPLNLIGLIVAVVLIYIIGGVLGSFLGRRLYRRVEEFISGLPVINRVYPSVKQVTEFLVGGGHDEDEDTRPKFSRVVAVQYPRKGLWSIGLVTGATLRAIQDREAGECITVFIPSSPTPFTGYVITVPTADTVDLPITIEDALRFTVSGGVLVPKAQQMPGAGARANELRAPVSPPPQD